MVGDPLYCAPEAIRKVHLAPDDRAVVLAAVQRNGYALEFASDTLRNDREVVLAAVHKNGDALEFASDTLRNDRALVLAAFQQNGCALEFASAALCDDPEIVLSAIQQNGSALKYASSKIRTNALFQKLSTMRKRRGEKRWHYLQIWVLYRFAALWLFERANCHKYKASFDNDGNATMHGAYALEARSAYEMDF